MRSIVLIKRASLLLALISAPAGAQTWSRSGLETANYKSVEVLIESLNTDARSIGLTEDRLRTRVELRLRSAGLTPVNPRFSLELPHLYVNINVIGDAFSILVEYRRQVDFITGNRQYRYLATTWRYGNAGTHGRDAAYITNALDEVLDKFLNEYLKANQK